MLQEQTVDPVGSSKSVPVDVRVVAATHRDLDKYIDRGDCEDLFYRLNVIPIIIPGSVTGVKIFLSLSSTILTRTLALKLRHQFSMAR